jgi:hypothetical protein
MDDESYRRRISTQLNRGESRHTLARNLFFGQRGQLRRGYREGQEEQLGALGLLLNVVVLWNSRYIGRILEHLEQQGQPARAEDIGRITPLIHAHIRFHGRYHFELPEQVSGDTLRPLRRADWPAD